MDDKKYIFLDIDGVMATFNQFDSKRHPEYDCYPFDSKCVNVLNEITDQINAIIILTSDWKLRYYQALMNKIFKWNGVKKPVSDYTPSFWGTLFKSLQDLEKCRASEIAAFVNKRNLTNNKWVAVDDLDLSPFLQDKNFVHTPRGNEGIKQTGIKEKILKRLM